MPLQQAPAQAYADLGLDGVRARYEEPFLARLVPRLLERSGGGAMLDLGCADALGARVAGPALTRYLGLDLRPTSSAHPCCAHDLRDGLGPVGDRSFDLYLGTFGVASHLEPSELRRLLGEVAAHARPGSVVALEALGLHSLEWPGIWSAPAGRARMLRYRLGGDVDVHPWSPAELFGLFEAAGITPLSALDRTVQAGPKAGEGRYWPGLPPVREGLRALLRSQPAPPGLSAALPPLPAGSHALLHHALANRRRELMAESSLEGPALAESIWALEPASAGGYGHFLLVTGRVA